MPAPDWQWVANPDLITSAIKLLAGAVFSSIITLGGIIVAGTKWVATTTMKRVESRMDGFEEKLERVAGGMETLALTTSNQITRIEVRCEERHSNHHRTGDAHV